jgi:hypothetical protein
MNNIDDLDNILLGLDGGGGGGGGGGGAGGGGGGGGDQFDPINTWALPDDLPAWSNRRAARTIRCVDLLDYTVPPLIDGPMPENPSRNYDTTKR